MKISVKRTLTLLLAAAIYISALTGCSSPLASDLKMNRELRERIRSFDRCNSFRRRRR